MHYFVLKGPHPNRIYKIISVRNYVHRLKHKQLKVLNVVKQQVVHVVN